MACRSLAAAGRLGVGSVWTALAGAVSTGGRSRISFEAELGPLGWARLTVAVRGRRARVRVRARPRAERALLACTAELAAALAGVGLELVAFLPERGPPSILGG